MHRSGVLLIALACSVAGSAAMADVVAVVAARSPVTALTRNQVLDIFLGRVNRYPDGTNASPIDQAAGSTLRCWASVAPPCTTSSVTMW